MATAVMATSVPRRRSGRLLFASSIERLLDWAEPTIRRVCREVWRELHPTGLEIEDLHQEGRIEVFLGARRIVSAQDPVAMTATLVRRRAIKAVRVLSDRYPGPQPSHSTDDPDADEADDLPEG